MTRRTLWLVCAFMLVMTAGALPVSAQETQDPGRPGEGPGPIPSVPTTADPRALTDTGPVEAAAGGNSIPTNIFTNWFAASSNPLTGYVSAATNAYAVYPVYLEVGESYAFFLDVMGSGNLNLYLYSPSAASLSDVAKIVKQSTTGTPDEQISGTASEQGYWYVVAKAESGASTYGLYGSFEAPNDNVPGVPLQYSPEVMYLDSFSDWSDLYHVWLNPGDVLNAQLTLDEWFVGFDPTLALYGPATSDIWTDGELQIAPQSGFPKTINYTATQAGYHYLDVYQSQYSATRVMGSAKLVWSVSSPVYRFYNAGSGTHFFTPSLEERNQVIAVWSNVFGYEGIAYYTQPYRNTQPLYRFYNARSASHFYTASLEEANHVIITWPNVFTYEGPTYKVSAVGPPDAAVYRFYNRRNGSHFYTASVQEADTVIANWSNIYTFEGPAFYLNP